MKFNHLILFCLILSSCGRTTTEKHEGHLHHAPVTVRNYADSVNAGIITKDTLRGSPTRVAMANIGDNHVHIVYGSPGVRGRIIWGGLVPYDEVWVSGAHNATSVEFSQPVEIDGKRVEAGKYALFTIPSRNEWTVILNTNWNQHLADDYSASTDVLRAQVAPVVQADTVQRLSYSVNRISDEEGAIAMEWERLKIEVQFRNLE